MGQSKKLVSSSSSTRLGSAMMSSNAQPSFIDKYSLVFVNHFRIESSVTADHIPVTASGLRYANNYRRMSPHEVLVPCFSQNMCIRKWRRSLIFIHNVLNRIQKFRLFLEVTRLREVDQPKNQIILLHNNKRLFKI